MSGSYMLILYVVVFAAIFYFMAIRPQQKQRRAHQELLASLKKGDRIVTAAGIYGTVKRIEENIVVVEVAKGVTMKIARRAVAEVIRDSAAARAAAPEGPVRPGPTRRGKRAPAEIEETTGEEVEAEDADTADETEEDTPQSGS